MGEFTTYHSPEMEINPQEKFEDHIIDSAARLGEVMPDGVEKNGRSNDLFQRLALPFMVGYSGMLDLIRGRDTSASRSLDMYFKETFNATREYLMAMGVDLKTFSSMSRDNVIKQFGFSGVNFNSMQLAPAYAAGGDNYINVDNITSLTTVTLMAGLSRKTHERTEDLASSQHTGDKGRTTNERRRDPVALPKDRKKVAMIGGLVVAGALSCCALLQGAEFLNKYLPGAMEYANNPEFRRQVDAQNATPVPVVEEQSIELKTKNLWYKDYVEGKNEADPTDIKHPAVKLATAYVGSTWMWSETRIDYLNKIFGEKFKQKFNRLIDKDDVKIYKNPDKFIELLKELEYPPKVIEFYQKRIDIDNQQAPNPGDTFLKEIDKEKLQFNLKDIVVLVGVVSAANSFNKSLDLRDGKRRAFLQSVKNLTEGAVKATNPFLTGMVSIARILDESIEEKD